MGVFEAEKGCELKSCHTDASTRQPIASDLSTEKNFFQPFCKNVRKLFVRVDTTNGSVAIQIDLPENAISVDPVHS